MLLKPKVLLAVFIYTVISILSFFSNVALAADLTDGGGVLPGQFSQFPVKKVIITADYNQKGSIWANNIHKGLDFQCNRNDPIFAIMDGVVAEVENSAGWEGIFVAIKHDSSIESIYAHLTAPNVKPGEKVYQGDIIGFCGETGNSTGFHLHLEVRDKGVAVNPWLFLPKSTKSR